MRIEVAIVAAALAVSCAGQVTEQAQGPLFWVSSVRANRTVAAQTPPFEFHWDVGTNPGNALEKLESYVVIVYYFGSREENNKADSARWAGFNVPGTVRSLPQGFDMAHAFGPGAGTGPIDHYRFEFYALNTKLELPVDTAYLDLLNAIYGHLICQTTWEDRVPGLPR